MKRIYKVSAFALVLGGVLVALSTSSSYAAPGPVEPDGLQCKHGGACCDQHCTGCCSGQCQTTSGCGSTGTRCQGG
jgi:hypothetical protein